MTVVAALNQQPAPPPDGSSQPVFMPSTVPPAFADAIGRCLNPDPARRLLRRTRPPGTQLTVAEPDPPASLPQSNVETEPPLTAAAKTSHGGVSLAQVGGGIILLSAVVWGGVHLMHGRGSLVPAPGANPAVAKAALPPPVSRPARPPLPQVAVAANPILHKEIPALPPHGALRTVRGRIPVLVTVTVDNSGNVIDETLEHPGSSKYFARVSTAAARKWRFAPATGPGTRKWLLRFEFTRTGASVDAAPTS